MISENEILNLGQGLEFRPLDEKTYLLSNTKHQHYLRISLPTYNLLCLINGKRTLQEICSQFNHQYKQQITTNYIQQVITALAPYGIVAGFDETVKTPRTPGYLKLSVLILSQKIVSKITIPFQFLFTSTAVVTVLILLSTCISIFYFSLLTTYQKFSILSCMPYIIILSGICLIWHEIGHATATRYFGAQHGGIGLGFYLLAPVFYANVTDIWRLEKSKRVWVNLAGIYFETIFCLAIFLAGWSLQDTKLIISSITIFLHSMINLNPFMRSDGYWILSDLTNIPNLMPQASRQLKRFFTKEKDSPLRWTFQTRFAFWYGVLNHICSIFFVGYMLLISPHTVMSLPRKFKELLDNKNHDNTIASYYEFFQLLVSLLFLAMIFRLLISLLTTFRQKRHRTTH